MNNGQYVRMARAALEREITVRELRVEYRKQAMLGDQITPVIYETEEYCMVSLNGEDGNLMQLCSFLNGKKIRHSDEKNDKAQ